MNLAEAFSTLKSAKNYYQSIRSQPKEKVFEWLDSLVEYSLSRGYDEKKTMMMLSLVRNTLPEPGQKFMECDAYDEYYSPYNQHCLEKYFKDQ